MKTVLCVKHVVISGLDFCPGELISCPPEYAVARPSPKRSRRRGSWRQMPRGPKSNITQGVVRVCRWSNQKIHRLNRLILKESL